MHGYDARFYRQRYELTRFAAEKVLAVVQGAIPHVHAAVDIGCGVGAWLKVLSERGASDILGIDGGWVESATLVIPSECFLKRDLSTDDLRLDRRFDLAISLEVAEHLPAARAEGFIYQLTQLSDFVLFSAAIPGQGGINHINERWPEYWSGLFERLGYRRFDFIRPAIWTEDHIPVHYRQNTFLYAVGRRVPELSNEGRLEQPAPLSVVHPQLYLDKLTELRNQTVMQSLELLGAAIGRRVRRSFGR
jgi:hypothetical protein